MIFNKNNMELHCVRIPKHERSTAVTYEKILHAWSMRLSTNHRPEIHLEKHKGQCTL